MTAYTLGFREIDKTALSLVGGKGANLGELSRINGILVPDGFCVTTKAWQEIIGNNEELNSLLDQLSRLSEARKDIGETSSKIRKTIENISIPEDLKHEITRRVEHLGERNAYAVRSSATAEDLPTASFAGQQDTYLNITGSNSILKHISKCWASLFTDRAVIYRLQNGFDHRKVQLSVVIQKMIFPYAAGIMFTADPVTSNRKIRSIDASFGLGEALVSGIVNADNYKVREGNIIARRISIKKLAVSAAEGGGTKVHEVGMEQQKVQTLSDKEITELERLGRKIESHFEEPQDIEWCVYNGEFYILQSRPITTLYPIPEANDAENHVYVSVGHQQMMTDAMKPLGLSVRQLTSNAPMHKAGGRLFVDITKMLSSTTGRETMINVLGPSDPLIKDALITIIERNFIKLLPDDNTGKSNKGTPHANYDVQIEYDPAIVPALIGKCETSMDELKKNIKAKSGIDLIDFILEDIQKLKMILSDPQSFGVLMTSMNASAWLNKKMQEWLGEKNAADKLSQSVSGNITSEMGLELLNVADVIRPYPEVVDYLQHVKDDSFLDEIVKLEGGQEARDAIDAYLTKYGMRCAGEIDITRIRWSEKPVTLVPLILSNVKNMEPDAGIRKFEQGRQEALKKEQEILERLRRLPDGDEKAEETKRMIDLVRNFAGYREYPKYDMVRRYFVYKKALMKEAGRLVHGNVIHDKEDIFYLALEELREVVRTNLLNHDIIYQRKEEHKLYEKLTPSRVITSDGEIITGSYKREDLPAGAIAALAVSSGIIEGRARVILKMEDADMREGDILVTTFTDPSWTPLFVSIAGLVTEVGGLMTHGAVIAREYGLPAVVGVDNATKLIKDGQWIRVNGTDGYVEILP
jgi:pyruvate,water dikinase